jgi:hypothetical protein
MKTWYFNYHYIHTSTISTEASRSEPTLIPKREGALSNNTLTYYMGLSNVVISELLGQNTPTDPFPHASSLNIPVCILWSINRHNFYAYKSIEQNLQKPKFTSHIHKNLPESTSFLTPKYSSKFRLLLRSSPSYVHYHLLGQVASVAENSNNQPSPLKQNSTPSFTTITREYKLPCSSMFIKDQTTI